MVPLSSISSIGIGTYRMSHKIDEHAEVLKEAIKRGCNLIDTSSNYGWGVSERLVGKVLQSTAVEVFVITKGGYASIDEVDLNSKAVTKLSESTVHTLDAKTLRKHFERSLERLGRKQVDAYLIHNPEYYLKKREGSYTDVEFFYQQMEKLFRWLESEVEAKRLRYYGVSSNSLPEHADKKNTIPISKLLQIAQSVSEKNHFKMIQFPYNLLEPLATESEHENGESLVSIARKNDIITLANRPLNANYNGGGVRLAEYKSQPENLDDNAYTECRHQFLDQLNLCLNKEQSHLSRQVRDFLAADTSPANIHAFDFYFTKGIEIQLNNILGPDWPMDLRKSYLNYSKIARNCANNAATVISNNIKKQVFERGNTKDEKLQNMLCRQYLDAGVDHVLVGMRKKEYLDIIESCS